MKTSIWFLSLILLFAGSSSALFFSNNSTCPPAAFPPHRVLMITEAFVDVHYSHIRAMAATSDGGVAYGTQNVGMTGCPRVVKLDFRGRFEWEREHCIGAEYLIVPRLLIEDGTGLYLVGDLIKTEYELFVTKFSLLDGKVLNSTVKMVHLGSFNIPTAVCDSRGRLVLGGYSDKGLVPRVFVVNATTVDDISEQIVSNLTHFSSGRIFGIVEDSGSYILAWRSGASIWVAAVDTLTWTGRWEHHVDTTQAFDCGASLVILSPGKYGVLALGLLIVATQASLRDLEAEFYGAAVTAAVVFRHSPDRVVLLSGDWHDTFAYWYDFGLNCTHRCSGHYPGLRISAAYGHPSYDHFWAIGFNHMPAGGTYHASVVRIEDTRLLSCHGDEVNYLGKGCYLPTKKSCFGLCESCLIPNDMNACHTPNAFASSNTMTFFAGRCEDSGYHYNAATRRCVLVRRKNCHPLCGGECLFHNSSSRCAHHCVGRRIEPNIDDSDLAHNVCKCRAGTAYDPRMKKCLPCSPLCGPQGCSQANDNSACLDCAISAVISPSTAGHVSCTCGPNSVLSNTSSACSPCHGLCLGCTAPGDSAKCISCARIPGVIKLGNSKCVCPAGAIYHDSGRCVYHSGCHPLCSGTCAIQADPTGCVGSCVAAAVGKRHDGDIYTCDCPIGTAFNGTTCASIVRIGCHPLCLDGCTERDNPVRCLDCARKQNVVSSPAEGLRNCSCLPDTSIFLSDEGRIAVCAYSTGCHPLCHSKCTIKQDPTKCVDKCRSDGGVIGYHDSEGAVKCGCGNGTHLVGNRECISDLVCDSLCYNCSSPDVCLRCVASRGTILSRGRCICAADFVRVPSTEVGSECIPRTEGATTALLALGYHSLVQSWVETLLWSWLFCSHALCQN